MDIECPDQFHQIWPFIIDSHQALTSSLSVPYIVPQSSCTQFMKIIMNNISFFYIFWMSTFENVTHLKILFRIKYIIWKYTYENMCGFLRICECKKLLPSITQIRRVHSPNKTLCQTHLILILITIRQHMKFYNVEFMLNSALIMTWEACKLSTISSHLDNELSYNWDLKIQTTSM
jgi:hypothetical protein